MKKKMNTTKEKQIMGTKKKNRLSDIYYPVPMDFNPIRTDKAPNNRAVIRRIIQGTIKVAYSLKDPKTVDYKGNHVKPKAVATDEQIELVMHLIESLQPADAIEATLASQFAITYIRSLEDKTLDGFPKVNLELFEFGHKVLEALQKYRSKGAQQIAVQYNVNQGQIFGQVLGVKKAKKNDSSIILEDATT